MFETGLVSISFRQLSPRELAALCAENQLHWIEWGSDVHAPCTDKERLSEIISLQKEYGLGCSSYGTYFKLGVHDTQELFGYMQAAKALGTNILRLWCGGKNFEDMTAEERTFVISESKKAAAIAEQAQVVLCMECHNNTFTNRKEAAYMLMQAVDSKHFRMYWQPNQYRTEEENLKYAALLAPFTEHLHVFNWEGAEKHPLGAAVAQWQKYLACFPGDRCCLLEFMPDDRLESLAEEARALKEIANG